MIGFWPAASEADDIVLFTGEDRDVELTRFPMLRQQKDLEGDPSRSLADFISPADSGRADYIGAFAVTSGLGAGTLSRQYEADNDDYSAIMVKALADRLAERDTGHVGAERGQPLHQPGALEPRVTSDEDFLPGKSRA